MQFPSLPNELHTFYAHFEQKVQTMALGSPAPMVFMRVNLGKASDPDGVR